MPAAQDQNNSGLPPSPPPASGSTPGVTINAAGGLRSAMATSAPVVDDAAIKAVEEKKVGDDEGGNGEKKDLLGILEKQGLVTGDQASTVRMEQVNTGKDLETILNEKAWVPELEMMKAKAELFEVPFINLTELTVSPEALALVPQSVAQKYVILPFDYDRQKNELSVAMADATDLSTLSFLEKKTGTRVKPHAAAPEELKMLIEERYGASLSSEVREVIKETDLGRASQVGPANVGNNVIREAPIAKIVTYILDYAIRTRASDVHIEPLEERTRVRYRIDGILHEKLVLPKKVHEALVSRIKILSGMKIDEKRLPQDGRFNFQMSGEDVDLRVSSLPTVNGEKVVMRLLKKGGGAASLSELGLRGRALKNLEEAILRPHGIILVCGPTGSGKTTTLYSVITKINTSKVNIVTLEDPVEYQMKGVNQVQINPLAGLTFASGLRSFLRQDPNVIMVGEVRDSETAELAVQAALTGHLVFSTLHTNNSAGSLPRLLDMGAEPFLLSSTINAVAAQRVVRVICKSCKTEYEPPEEIVKDMKEVLGKLFPKTDKEKVPLYKGKGCAECSTTGYSGRVGIFEVLPVTEKIGRLILERSPASVIEERAFEEGMISMKQDGYLKVLEGTTTIEEVLRVAQD